MPYKLAMFDFDGTLADSFPFFLSVFNTLAERHRFSPIDCDRADSLRHYSASQMMKHVGMPAWKLPIVSASFIAMMKESAASIAPFEGIEEALAALSSAGMQLAVVSSNSEHNVRTVLGPELASRFKRYECGMSIFGKAAKLRQVTRDCGLSPADAIYIGDHGTDAQAANKAGIAFGAVCWGYCPIEGLRQFNPHIEFETPDALRQLATERT